MKVKRFNLKSLYFYKNPAIILFRGIELNFLSKVLSKIKLSQPSLDLGSGDGFISSILFDKKFTVGVDNNENKDTLISIKKKRYKKVLIESAEKMSIKSESLNFVFSNSVIEHIPKNRAVLAEVSRVLKPGGYFIFTCPSSYFTSYFAKNRGMLYAKLRNRHLNHYHLLSHIQWKKRLKKAGLKVLSHHYYMTKSDLMFWDMLVWLYKFLLLFKKTPLHSQLKKHYLRKIKKIVLNAKTSKKQGSNILIVAKK